jgi:hypothetical protein
MSGDDSPSQKAKLQFVKMRTACPKIDHTRSGFTLVGSGANLPSIRPTTGCQTADRVSGQLLTEPADPTDRQFEETWVQRRPAH